MKPLDLLLHFKKTQLDFNGSFERLIYVYGGPVIMRLGAV